MIDYIKKDRVNSVFFLYNTVSTTKSSERNRNPDGEEDLRF